MILTGLVTFSFAFRRMKTLQERYGSIPCIGGVLGAISESRDIGIKIETVSGIWILDQL